MSTPTSPHHSTGHSDTEESAPRALLPTSPVTTLSPPLTQLSPHVSDDDTEPMEHSDEVKETDPEEEPMEEQGDSSSGETVPHTVVFGDSSSSEDAAAPVYPLPPSSRPAPPPPRSVSHIIVPLHRAPNGMLMKTTARKRILPPRNIQLGKRPAESPPAPPSPPKRLRATARKMTWMPHTLRGWMAAEGISPTLQTGEPSRPLPPLPLLDQPTERAVPTLVARVARHDQEIDDLKRDLEKLKEEKAEEPQDAGETIEQEKEEVDSTPVTPQQQVPAQQEQQAAATAQLIVDAREQADRAMALALAGSVMAALAMLIGVFSRFIH